MCVGKNRHSNNTRPRSIIACCIVVDLLIISYLDHGIFLVRRLFCSSYYQAAPIHERHVMFIRNYSLWYCISIEKIWTGTQTGTVPGTTLRGGEPGALVQFPHPIDSLDQVDARLKKLKNPRETNLTLNLVLPCSTGTSTTTARYRYVNEHCMFPMDERHGVII